MAFETPLETPAGLLKFIEKLPTNNANFLANRFSRLPYLGDGETVEWDIIRDGQTIARPNVPGAKSNLVDQLGRGQMSSRGLRSRESKQFKASVVQGLREPGQLQRANAERLMAREIKDLNNRVERLVEKCYWGLLTGTLSLEYGDPNGTATSTVSIDYGLPTANKPSVGTSWDTATPPQIIADIRAWRKVIENGSGVTPTEAFASEAVLGYMTDSWAANGESGVLLAGNLMSDRMRDEYFRTGDLPDFMGMSWRRTREVYTTVNGGTQVPFFGESSLILGNFSENDPIYLYEMKPNEMSVAPGYRGKFSKTWDLPDASARVWLVEYAFCPVDERPEQRVYVADVTTP